VSRPAVLRRTNSDPAPFRSGALLPREAAPTASPLRRLPGPRTLAASMPRRPSSEPVLVKKYGNRRLYDTQQSRYVTQEELEATIREGQDVRVLDAKTGEDLTQATLAQIILEGRRAAGLLPVPLLVQLIRMSDDSLTEFLGRYLGATLEMYLEAKRGAETLSPYLPMATMPFSAASAIARMWLGAGQMIAPEPRPAPVVLDAPPDETTQKEVAALRRELDELKASLPRRKR
jgi:polyhydroxyalkanoate synthesis repressor PhaR